MNEDMSAGEHKALCFDIPELTDEARAQVQECTSVALQCLTAARGDISRALALIKKRVDDDAELYSMFAWCGALAVFHTAVANKAIAIVNNDMH